MVSLVHNGGAAPAAGVPLTGDGGATTAAMVSGSGSGEGSSSTATVNASQRSPLRTLDDVMRAPSATLPDVIVLEGLPDGLDRREVLDPKEDLWLSTADGRYSSPMIPIVVGQHPSIETFYVHKHILTKHEFFEKALCGKFSESHTQSLKLPEEDPAIFHFLIAYLYEGRYDPIRPIASALLPDQDKGKGKDVGLGVSINVSSDSEDSAGSFGSDISAQSRRRRERRHRRQERHFERMRQKHPGAHRPNCGCPTCLSSGGPPCWACAAPRHPPPPQPALPPGVIVLDRDGNPRADHRRPGPRRRHHNPHPNPHFPPPPMNQPPIQALPPLPGGWQRGPVAVGGVPEGRIFGEDLRTWLLAYELNIDVYILANKFLLEGFKREIARAAIDMLETAGADAAVPQVLRLCAKLHGGLPQADPLLKMVFARVGFLQSLLWRRAPEETEEFLVGNPDVAAVMLRETVVRREEEFVRSLPNLPSMERPWGVAVGGGYDIPGALAAGYRGAGGPVPYHHYPRGARGW